MNQAAYLLTGICLSFYAGLACAADAPAAVVAADVARDYLQARQRIDVGHGRKMNLDCRGKGPVTVVFDAGLSDWSDAWVLVQPQIAQRTRACSYDRAGMGYSDPATRPATTGNIVDDLHKLLKTAGIQGPLVLVGHSLGGVNMKLYAVTYPRQVAGLVLVDPSNERMEVRIRDKFRAKFGDEAASKLPYDEYKIKAVLAKFQHCAATSRIHDLDPDSALYKSCTDPAVARMGPEIAAARKAVQVTYAYQGAQLSEISNFIFHVDARRDAEFVRVFHPTSLGDMPVVVLSAGYLNPAHPDYAKEQFVRLSLHEEMAATSTQGVHRVVPDTKHNIQQDRPEAIIDAIGEVLDKIAGNKKS